MCSVFGLLDFKGKLPPAERLRIVKALGVAAEVRGTDATGVAYVQNGAIQIQKAPRPAHKMRWRIAPDARYIMGHTRMTTQGSERHNQNNHPFPGKAGKIPVALAHNGVLYNDAELRVSHKLPQTKIETDNYVAVQLLEQKGDLFDSSIQHMAEALDGSFTITILDAKSNLYFIKGNNPLTILLLPDLGCYLYASTEEILNNALETLGMANVNAVDVKINPGDIMCIDAKGQRSVTHFDDSKLYHSQYTFWPYWTGTYADRSPATLDPFDQMYLDELKSVAGYYGYTPESIDRLIRQGFLLEEIEELLYEGMGVV